MNAADHFSETAEQARNRFLAACDRIGLRVTSYPSKSQDYGAELSCDVTRLGSPEARKFAVLASGAAGQAGLVSCAACLNVVAGGGLKDLPRDVGLLLIHAANPHGPVWPFSAPENEATALEGAPGWSDTLLDAAEQRLRDYRENDRIDWRMMGEKPLSSMASPAWNGATVQQIARDYLKNSDDLCLIDVRTGPGSYKDHAIVPCDPLRSAARERAERWFTIDLGTAAQAVGMAGTPCAGGLGRAASGMRVTSILLELGTHKGDIMLSRGKQDAISAYPTSPEWRHAAWETVRETLRRAYKGLLIGN